MPYIPPNDRQRLDAGGTPHTVGELNYVITRLVDKYMQHHGGASYTQLNAVIGAMECAKLELYRRIAAPYEDEKIRENGEVYTLKRMD